MKQKVFTGVATALVTPMYPDGRVNYERLSGLVDEQISDGVDALLICGTTGEKSTLRYDEHIRVLEVAAKSAAKRVPIIAGTGSNDTVYSVELCRDAESVGVDALLMVTPYYNKTSQAGLIEHYNYVADRVEKPIILYNVPSRTGVGINPETYYELSKHPNIVATKEANGDLSSVAKTRYLCGDNLQIYSGNDDQAVAMMSLGGIGVISVISNIMPKLMHDICSLYLSGKTDEARDLQLKNIGLMNALFSDVNPIPIKEAMNLMGLDVGPCRLPLCKMNQNARLLMIEKLKECGCLKAGIQA